MIENKEPLWELSNVTKIFPGLKALNKVSMKIYRGEIHGLVGENGSGKSTLIKCISGVYQPDEGTIYYKGEPVYLKDPIYARRHGVATIFQEFSLINNLTVAENIFLGRWPVGSKNKVGFVKWKEMKNKAVRVLERLNIYIDPEKIVGELSVAQQQLVEIAKALSVDSSLVIMDEPTTTLGFSEIKQLHSITRNIASNGYAVIYISHRLNEVVELVDRASIMKDGQLVGEFTAEEINIPSIVKLMIGDEIKEHYPKERNATDEVLFSFNNLCTKEGVSSASFDVRRGEIFGLAGLIGSGRSEIARAIFGADKLIGGTIEKKSTNLKKPYSSQDYSPQKAINNGIALITENKKYDGLFMNFFAQENITIANLKNILVGWFLSLKKENSATINFINKFQISTQALQKTVQFLSGGNQQKVIIARWIFSQADLFIMDEPTQGIDVLAKVFIYKLMNDLTRQGKSIIFISVDFPEIIAMSDRIGIVKGGKIIEICDATSVNRSDLMQKTLATN